MNPLIAAIELFSRHRNAANLLFISMIMFGFFGLSQLNRQFFPTVDVKNVTIRVNWPGATAQDVDKNIVAAIQPEIRFLDGVKEVRSESRQNFAAITVEFEQEADMQRAVADIEAAVSALTTLPKQAERPIIKQEVFFEPIASLLISGPYDEAVCASMPKICAMVCLMSALIKLNLRRFGSQRFGLQPAPNSYAAII